MAIPGPSERTGGKSCITNVLYRSWWFFAGGMGGTASPTARSYLRSPTGVAVVPLIGDKRYYGETPVRPAGRSVGFAVHQSWEGCIQRAASVGSGARHAGVATQRSEKHSICHRVREDNEDPFGEVLCFCRSNGVCWVQNMVRFCQSG